VFAEDMNSQSFERLALESSVRLAYERSEFEIHYQPKLVVGANRITGMEALLRWHHPDLGVVSPAKFIPIAEETGLIVPIGKWVLRQACLQNVAWQKAGFPELCVAVNLSPRQFSEEHLLADITAILAETGLDPKLLELEITEGMLMQNIERSIEVLSALRKIGVKLAIDDFGTGYSSLAHLKRFPLDIIKGDRSFIRDLGDDAGDRGITEAIIAMGKTLSLTVIAEGVENKEQLDFLEAHECDEFQGFYFSKAVSADDFTKLLEMHRPAVGAAEAA
jgi:EAL domain-containing protein (putative c-di-GMP-specific phosphodiesterase class I)